MENNIFCCQSKINNLYNIDENDIYKPIELFSKDFNITFNYNKSDKLIQNNDNDNVMNYFIKSSKDISIIFVYPKALKHKKLLKNMYDKLNKNGVIFYEKNIELTSLSVYNLIFQLYFNESRMKNPMSIIYKVKRIGFDDFNEKVQNVKVIVYKHKNNKIPINGNSSPFKMELRQLFYDQDIKNIDESELKLYDYIHVNNDDNQAYVYAGILFNENSLNFLKKQNSWKIYEMYKSINLFNKFKNYINKYGIIGFETTLLFSSSILFSLGVREMNDIDGYIVNNNYINMDELNEFNEGNIDLTFKGSKQTNIEWLKTLNDRAKQYGAKNFDELVINPKYHYYFMGVKFLRLKYDIITRLSRGRPAQITDLLVIRQLYNLKYNLSVPDVTKKYDEELKKDIEKKVDEDKFLDTIRFYLLKRYYIKLSNNQIKDWIYNYKIIDNNHVGGGSKYLIEISNISKDKYIYPKKEEVIKMGYLPKLVIYSDGKPYLYPGEMFKLNSIIKFCNKKDSNKFKEPYGELLSVMSFNVHNFITRCNSGISPIFNTINPYNKGRDINKFIELFKKYSPDILCLQEVVPILKGEINEDINDYEYIRNNFNFDYLNKLMENIGYQYNVIGNTKQGNLFEDENKNYFFLANVIYSKIKIDKYKINQFSFLDRNFIHITFKYKNEDIDLINIHMEYFDAQSVKYPELSNITLLQHNIFREYIKSINNDNIIICGDFNINIVIKQPNKRHHDFNDKTEYYRDNFNIINYFKISTNFSQNTVTDFILLNKKSNLKQVYNNIINSELSDHYPIIVYFKISNNTYNKNYTGKKYTNINTEINNKTNTNSNWKYYKKTLDEIENIIEYYKNELIKYYSVHIHKKQSDDIDMNVLKKNIAIFTYFNNIPNKFMPLPKYICFNYCCYITFINPENFNLDNDDIIIYDQILNDHYFSNKILQDKAPYNNYKKNIAINIKYFDINRYLSNYYILLYTDKSKIYHISKNMPQIEGNIIYASILRRIKQKELDDVFITEKINEGDEIYSFHSKKDVDTKNINWFSLTKKNMLNDPYNLFYKNGEDMYMYTGKVLKNITCINLNKNVFLKGNENLDLLFESYSDDYIYNGFLNYVNYYEDDMSIWKKNKGKRLLYEIIYKNSNVVFNNIYFFDFLKRHGYNAIKYSLGFYEKTNKFYDYEVGIHWEDISDYIKISNMSKTKFISH